MIRDDISRMTLDALLDIDRIAGHDDEVTEWRERTEPVIDALRAALAEIERPCTCHPADNPPTPCVKQYALDLCRKAAQACCRA